MAPAGLHANGMQARTSYTQFEKMKTILLIISMTIVGAAFGQDSKTTPINIGESILFHSTILNEDRTVLIHDPNQYLDTAKQSKHGVIYVLDGHDHFRYLVGLLHRMGGDFLPKMIIVGVTQNNRPKDLGPDGFDDFNHYLEQELIPYINSNYKTSSENILLSF